MLYTVSSSITEALSASHGSFTLLSLALTWPALAVSIGVLMSWHRRYIEYCKAEIKTPSMLLIAGIYISFLGFAVDNLYWGVAWSLDFIADPSALNDCRAIKYYGDLSACKVIDLRDKLFHNGVYSNVVFRQGLGLWAGALHIHAENMSRKTEIAMRQGKSKTKLIIFGSCVFGIVYAGMLVAIKTL